MFLNLFKTISMFSILIGSFIGLTPQEEPDTLSPNFYEQISFAQDNYSRDNRKISVVMGDMIEATDTLPNMSRYKDSPTYILSYVHTTTGKKFDNLKGRFIMSIDTSGITKKSHVVYSEKVSTYVFNDPNREFVHFIFNEDEVKWDYLDMSNVYFGIEDSSYYTFNILTPGTSSKGAIGTSLLSTSKLNIIDSKGNTFKNYTHNKFHDFEEKVFGVSDREAEEIKNNKKKLTILIAVSIYGSIHMFFLMKDTIRGYKNAVIYNQIQAEKKRIGRYNKTQL